MDEVSPRTTSRPSPTSPIKTNMIDPEKKIYNKLSVGKKIKIVSDFYLLGEKLASLNDRGIYDRKKNQKDREPGRVAL